MTSQASEGYEWPDVANWEPCLSVEHIVEGTPGGALLRDHQARYEFAAEYCRGECVLDVAAGTGYGTNLLNERGARQVTAVDRAQGPLDYARHRFGERGMRWVRSDPYELPFEDGTFDVVVSYETIEHLQQPDRFLLECKRALRAGGTLLLSSALKADRSLSNDQYSVRFSIAEFRAMLAPHFARVELWGQRRERDMKLRPLGRLPERYLEQKLRLGAGHHAIYRTLERVNELPNDLAAWASGLSDSFRSRIRRISEPLPPASFFRSGPSALIAVCR